MLKTAQSEEPVVEKSEPCQKLPQSIMAESDSDCDVVHYPVINSNGCRDVLFFILFLDDFRGCP